MSVAAIVTVVVIAVVFLATVAVILIGMAWSKDPDEDYEFEAYLAESNPRGVSDVVSVPPTATMPPPRQPQPGDA